MCLVTVGFPVQYPLLEDILVERLAEVEVEAGADTMQDDVVAEVPQAGVVCLDLRLKDLHRRLEDLDLLGVQLCLPRLRLRGMGMQKTWLIVLMAPNYDGAYKDIECC